MPPRNGLHALFFFAGMFVGSNLSLGTKRNGVNNHDQFAVNALTKMEKGSQGETTCDVVSQCQPLTEKERNDLENEVAHYKTLSKYRNKIKEAKGENPIGGQHLSIMKFLKENVLEAGWSVLDLGAAAGAMLRYTMDAYRELNHLNKVPRGNFQGVELVDGWVDFAKDYFNNHVTYGHVGFAQGDVTNFTVEGDQTFDFVMLNDVMEHLQIKRYGCFFNKLWSVTHAGSIVYMHTPTPEAQNSDKGQFYENVLPHHILVAGMARQGFQLLSFQYDISTVCGGRLKESAPRVLKKGKCMVAGWPKYYHVLFVRTANPEVFKLK